MELGISTYTFPWAIGTENKFQTNSLNAIDLLELAIQYQIRRVQFCDNLPLHELSESYRNQINEKAKKADLKLEVGTRGLTINNISRYIEIAKEFGSPFLRVVIDDADYEPNVTEVVKIIKQLLPILKKNQVVLAIENHDRFSSEILKSIILDTDPKWVGICLDTANSLGAAGEGCNDILQTLGQFTVNLHIKDIKINRVDHKMGFIVKGCEAGAGIIDIGSLLDFFKSESKLISLTLELWSNPLPLLGDTIKQEKEWATKSIQYLKRKINNF